MSRLIQTKQIDFLVGQQKWNTSGATLPTNGTPKDVTSLFTGKTAGGSDLQSGVYTSSPQNKIYIKKSGDSKYIADPATGLQIYARLTEATGVWSLSFFTSPAGVESAFDFSGHDDAGDAFDFRWCETTQAANTLPTRIVDAGETIDELLLNTTITSHRHETDAIVVATNGQTVFSSALTGIPTDGAHSELLINGIAYNNPADYTTSGQNLTWANTLFSLETTDEIYICYQVEKTHTVS
jgi:hypothetical protein